MFDDNYTDARNNLPAFVFRRCGLHFKETYSNLTISPALKRL